MGVADILSGGAESQPGWRGTEEAVAEACRQHPAVESAWTTPMTRDGGYDVVVEGVDGRRLVEVKDWSSPVDASSVRSLVEQAGEEGAELGYFSTSGYTDGAKVVADDHGVHLSAGDPNTGGGLVDNLLGSASSETAATLSPSPNTAATGRGAADQGSGLVDAALGAIEKTASRHYHRLPGYRYQLRQLLARGISGAWQAVTSSIKRSVSGVFRGLAGGIRAAWSGTKAAAKGVWWLVSQVVLPAVSFVIQRVLLMVGYAVGMVGAGLKHVFLDLIYQRIKREFLKRGTLGRVAMILGGLLLLYGIYRGGKWTVGRLRERATE
jgi:hypothetical protein